MTDIVRVGVIGIGHMGTGHCQTILSGKVPGMKLTAVADIKQERRKWASENLPADVQIFDSDRALIASGTCDAVMVVVPHYFHPEISIRAMQQGLHVLCEKPAGVYTRQVKEMNEAAEKSDRVFAIMFNQRTNPAFIKMHDLVKSGELGTIKRVNWIITDWYRTQAYYDSGEWRATWDGEGGGVLLNQCPHQLDLLQWICGMPIRVSAHCHIGKWHHIEVEDDVTAYLEYENGATGVFIASTGDAPGTNRFEVTLERGKLVCENDRLSFYELEVSEREYCYTATEGFAKPAGHEVTLTTDGENPQHVGVLRAFAANILRGEPLIARGEEGINGLTLSNAMHLSSWLGKPVDIPFDEDLFLEKLNELRKTSRVKENVQEVTFSTAGSYGTKEETL